MHRRVGPVQAEHLAGQVVGADREEVARAGEHVGRRSRGGQFHHHAEFGHVGADLVGGVHQRRPHLGHLVQGAHHGHHDAQPGFPATAQHRAELIAQRAWVAEQRRQACLPARQEGGDLVSGEVEQADDHGPPREQSDHRVQRSTVIGLRRPHGRAGKRDLGAQQAHARGAGGQAEPGLGGGRHVAEQGDLLAIGGARRTGWAGRGARSGDAIGGHGPVRPRRGCGPGDGGQFLR